MQITQIVAERWRDGQEEGDLGRGAAGCGLEAEVAVAGVDIPVLDAVSSHILAEVLVKYKRCEGK